MINVADMINDPDFATDFQVVRRNGAFATTGLAAGEWVPASDAPVDVVGIIHPGIHPDALEMVPEGVRSLRAISVWVDIPLVNGDGTGATGTESDIILWKNETWKVKFVHDWSDNGYWFAIAVDEVLQS